MVGPLSFATSDVEGAVSMVLLNGAVDTGATLTARLVVPLQTLTSGNNLYDSELRRRIDTRRHPLATLDLKSASRIEETNRYDLVGEMGLHNEIRAIAGTVSVSVPHQGTVVVRGEQTFDIRDFNLEPPTTFSFKIYPDVFVEMHLEVSAK
jgi:polyisoprenoid-binding protein YceI